MYASVNDYIKDLCEEMFMSSAHHVKNNEKFENITERAISTLQNYELCKTSDHKEDSFISLLMKCNKLLITNEHTWSTRKKEHLMQLYETIFNYNCEDIQEKNKYESMIQLICHLSQPPNTTKPLSSESKRPLELSSPIVHGWDVFECYDTETSVKIPWDAPLRKLGEKVATRGMFQKVDWSSSHLANSSQEFNSQWNSLFYNSHTNSNSTNSTEDAILNFDPFPQDEGFVSPSLEEIFQEEEEEEWNIDLLKEYDPKILRTWEYWGLGNAPIEPPFVTDCVINTIDLIKSEQHHKIPIQEFLEDVKYLLLGLPSTSFPQKNDKLYFDEKLCIGTVCSDVIVGISQVAIEYANCYRSLKKVATGNSKSYLTNGYVTQELCICILDLLRIYDEYVFEFDWNSGRLLRVSALVESLKVKILTLSRILFTEPPVILPRGAHVLQHIYNRTIMEANGNSFVIHPCLFEYTCKPYLRLLSNWIFEGISSDELFVKKTSYMKLEKTRSYWDVAFEIDTSLVPSFFPNLTQEVLLCGKLLNILRVYLHKEEYCITAQEKHPEIRVCFNESEYTEYCKEWSAFYEKCEKVCKYSINLVGILKPDCTTNFEQIHQIQQEWKITNKENRMKMMKEQNELKQMEIERNRNILDIGLSMKYDKKISELTEEKRINEKVLNEAIEDAAYVTINRMELIKYYEDLNKRVDERHKLTESQMNKFKNKSLKNSSSNTSLVNNSLEDEGKENDEIISEPSRSTNSHPEIIGLSNGEAHPEEGNLESVEEEFKDERGNECIEIVPRVDEVDVKCGNDNEVLCNGDLDVGREEMSTEETEAMRNKRKIMSSEYHIRLKENGNEVHNNTQPVLNEIKSEAMRNKEKVMHSEYYNDLNKMVENPKDESKLMQPIIMSQAMINKSNMMASEYHIRLSESYLVKENQKEESVMLKENEEEVEKEGKEEGKEIKGEDTKEEEKGTKEEGEDTKEEEKGTKEEGEETEEEEKETKEEEKETKGEEEGKEAQEALVKVKDMTVASKIKNFSFGMEWDEKFTFIEIIKENKLRKYEEKIDYNSMMMRDCITKSLAFPIKIHYNFLNNSVMHLIINELNFPIHLKEIGHFFLLRNPEFLAKMKCKFFTIFEANTPSKNMDYFYYEFQEIISEFTPKLQLSLDMNYKSENQNPLNFISLRYYVEWPINLIITEHSMICYNEIFKLLLKCERACWIIERDFYEFAQKRKLNSHSQQYTKINACTWRMLQFMNAIKRYLLIDVLGVCWEKLLKKLKNSQLTLDSLYKYHKEYLTNMLTRCLLLDSTMNCHKLLSDVFDCVSNFHITLNSGRWYKQQDTGLLFHTKCSLVNEVFASFILKLSDFRDSLEDLIDRKQISCLKPLLELITSKLTVHVSCSIYNVPQV